MPKLDQQHYQQKLSDIKARHLSKQQRMVAFLVSALFWLALYLLISRIQLIWVPYVVSIQSLKHLAQGYLTYFFAGLFMVLWLVLIIYSFKLALKYWVRGLSGLKET